MIVLMKCLDEERAVKRCISNFYNEPFCERIIVIDGGSTDYTRQELKQFSKVEVFVHPWLDEYHDMEVIQSNIGLSYIPENEWCFILDFDEKCNRALKDFLNTFDSKEYERNVINVARETTELCRYEDSPHCILDEDGWPVVSHRIGQWPDYQARIIQKSYKMKWINSPHHMLIGGDAPLNLNQDCYMIHYEKDDLRDRERIEKKWLRAQARRKQLGLSYDVFETKLKPEVAKFADPDYWKE